MASASVVRKIRGNMWVQLAAVEMMVVNLKHDEDGSPEYKAAARQVFDICKRRLGLDARELKVTYDEIAELAQKMERALVNAGLLSRDN